MRPPTGDEFREFIAEDGWERQQGRKRHAIYRRRLGDRVLRTEWPHSDQIDDRNLWGKILRDQLEVSEDEFWRVVAEGGPAVRPSETAEGEPSEEKPLWLVQRLTKTCGLSIEEVAGLSLDRAQAAWDRYCMTGTCRPLN